jgi:hypothetical protein
MIALAAFAVTHAAALRAAIANEFESYRIFAEKHPFFRGLNEHFTKHEFITRCEWHPSWVSVKVKLVPAVKG